LHCLLSVLYFYKPRITFSDAEADADRGEDEAEDGDEDGERGAEPEAGEEAAEAAVAARQGRRGAVRVQRGKGVEAGGGAGMVVRSHLEVVGCGWGQPAHAVQVLQLQVVRHCEVTKKHS
jgi:hypothetical protein